MRLLSFHASWRTRMDRKASRKLPGIGFMIGIAPRTKFMTGSLLKPTGLQRRGRQTRAREDVACALVIDILEIHDWHLSSQEFMTGGLLQSKEELSPV